MSRKAVVLRHVPQEGLDALAPILLSEGYAIEYIDVPVEGNFTDRAERADVLVVLGGPVGVYDTDRYPFLQEEIELLEQRLAHERPTLGICLGAQLMAAALGSRVYRGENGREIGWHALELTEAGRRSALAPLDGLQVFQWHQDTFDLPPQAVHLARSATYANQAFAVGQHALALQFHIEVSAPGLELWFEELQRKSSTAGINLDAIRKQSVRAAPIVNGASVHVLGSFLSGRTLAGGTSGHNGSNGVKPGCEQQEVAMSSSLESRVTDLEVKLSFAEDMLDRLNETVVKQQRQIEALAREVVVLRDQIPEVDGRTPHEPGDEIPPHY